MISRAASSQRQISSNINYCYRFSIGDKFFIIMLLATKISVYRVILGKVNTYIIFLSKNYQKKKRF